MKKSGMLLSVLVLAAMILAACGGAATSTNIPNTSVPSSTPEVTETSSAGSGTATESSTATEAPTEATTATPGIPVTGAVNADRLSNELKFKVLDQSGKQVGKVDDMVLDLSKAKVLYVIVGAAKKIAVPWAFLKVSPASASSYPNEQQNTFILQTDTDTFKNAPEFNVKNMPQLGEAPDSWDIAFRKYWEGSGTSSGNNTPAPAGTATTDMTATATTTSGSGGTGTGNTTSTPTTSAGASQGTATGQGATSIQGVQLASQVLGAKVTVGATTLSLGTSTPAAVGTATGLATSTPSTSSTGSATSTPGTGTVATSTSSAGASSTAVTSSAGTSTNSLSATISDMIVNNDAGEIMYIVIKASFDDGEHLIPVPLGLLELISSGSASDTGANANQSFVLNIDPTVLQNAPVFENGQIPDTTTSGWNNRFDAFWQSNASGGASGTGSGTGGQATATATP